MMQIALSERDRGLIFVALFERHWSAPRDTLYLWSDIYELIRGSQWYPDFCAGKAIDIRSMSECDWDAVEISLAQADACCGLLDTHRTDPKLGLHKVDLLRRLSARGERAGPGTAELTSADAR